MNTDKMRARLEDSNEVILKFNILYYTALFVLGFSHYFILGKSQWMIGLTVCSAAALVVQIALFPENKESTRYGWISLVVGSIVLMYTNGTTENSLVLLMALPMTTWAILYMDKRILHTMYGVGAFNAVIRYIWLLSQPQEEVDIYLFYAVLGLSVLFSIAAGMVSRAVGRFYYDICEDLSVTNRIHKQLYKKSLIDTTTDLMNRNAYNEYVENFDSKGIKNVCCIYIDVNGLHEYNNTYGHQAGDKMLKIVGTEMKRCFAGCRNYRIGGDEFVVIQQDAEFNDVMHCLRAFKSSMKKHGIHVAAGLEWRDEDMDIDDIIGEADAKMYIDKEKFYMEHGEGREDANIYTKTAE